MTQQSFGAYLQRLRKAKGLTLTQLGNMIGYSNPYMSQIENRVKANPSPEMLRKLSAALGVSYIGMLIKAGYLTEEELIAERAKRGVGV